ncbi:hypothetical protein HQ945_12875 [Phyllobacterium sp. BT25]|uniref:Uncharacterized protein n=1 Tax=Phyllobacterium pellucidum TaxID=2740464 RepID=A0A849VQJ4_9HYPH|nr:hypothetical protein [Phyllobacterium pellucidum]NTS32151.1 hypothetical protein [Phyllobacterium pellucidum]
MQKNDPAKTTSRTADRAAPKLQSYVALPPDRADPFADIRFGLVGQPCRKPLRVVRVIVITQLYYGSAKDAAGIDRILVCRGSNDHLVLRLEACLAGCILELNVWMEQMVASNTSNLQLNLGLVSA